ncbi:MAG: acetyltransferase [Thermodesulfobacteriota bacterium]
MTDAQEKPIVFWGATGQAKVVWDCLRPQGYRLVALFDNNADLRSPFSGVPLYHGESGFSQWLSSTKALEDEVYCLVAIGGSRGQDRLQIQRYLADHGLRPIVAIHPRASLAEGISVGEGSQILAHAAVGASARIGEACIVNTGAIVEHDCKIGDGVHLAPGSILAGELTVDAFTMIGAGAVVLPRLNIGKNVVVGAGSVVTKDIADNLVVAGNPAQILSKKLQDGPSSP